MPARASQKSWCAAMNGASYAPERVMPSSSPKTAFPTGWRIDPLQRGIGLARAVLVIEKILPRLWPAAGFALFYLALALTGVFALIPWPVQALLLAATIPARA